jgi:D-glycero-alpha-D-manno-heptose-7-phosphate kinase
MIITRTPLRISLGGGGTDLPSYYEHHGGFVIAGAISKHVYLGINRTFTDDYFVKYSALERVKAVDDLEHPIVRAALKLHDVEPSIEIVSMADIPSGTGLGSSGAFTVGLLRAIYALQRRHVTPGSLADEACHIEIDLLARAVGKQDQYIAAFGGLACFEIDTDGSVHVSPMMVSNDTLHDLEDHLLMFFTGYSRDADRVLLDQKVRSEHGDPAMLDNLHEIRRIGVDVREALERGDPRGFADLMHEHWTLKRVRTADMTNDHIDEWYDVARRSGAIGGKLVGAGAGGFLLLYSTDSNRLREAMTHAGLSEVRFTFDQDGASVCLRD